MPRQIIRVYSTVPVLLLYSVLGCGGVPPEREPGYSPANSYYSPGWAPGQWVRYEFISGGVKKNVYIAVTDSEYIRGDEYFWIETVSKSDSAVIASRQLVIDVVNDPFLKTSGGLLPGADRYVVKYGQSPPYEMDIPTNETPAGLDFHYFFGGGRDLDIITVSDNVDYTTKSGKTFVCDGKSVLTGDKTVGRVYISADVPVTGIAKSETLRGKLELVDFGYSGADSIF